METQDANWRLTDLTVVEGPTLDFILAVAALLESSDDLLAEMGYINPEILGSDSVQA